MSSAKEILIENIIANITDELAENSKATYLFDIQSILGINCFVELKFVYTLGLTNMYTIYLLIQHRDMMNDSFITLHNYTFGTFISPDATALGLVLDSMKKRIQNLKFDVYSGMFVTKDKISTIPTQIDFFSDIPSIKIVGEECPVCKDCIINTNTNCSHYLCVPCFQDIKYVESEDDDGEQVKKCPICRDHITYTH